jgi:DNA-binding NtrC family response regulator
MEPDEGNPSCGRGAEGKQPAAGRRDSASVIPTDKTCAKPAAVLVVEDQDALRLAVVAMLERNGFTVVEAGDGDAALALVDARKDIGVVLLDVTLPGKSGRVVLEEFRRVRPDLKVILTSGYAQDRAASEFAGLTVDGFIRKPYAVADLVEKLRLALE